MVYFELNRGYSENFKFKATEKKCLRQHKISQEKKLFVYINKIR